MPRFAANLSLMFHEWPFLDRFAVAADAGFSAVECQFPYEYPAEHIAHRLEQNGLTMVLFNVPAGDWAAGDRGLAALPERWDLQRDAVSRAIEYARVTRTSSLHLLAGIADRADSSALAAYHRAVEHAAGSLQEFALTLLIEPINSRDMPGYFLDNFEFAESFIVSAGIANLKLQFDIYHRQIICGDVVKGLERLLPIIGHVQVASVPYRAEPGRGELQEAYLFSLLDSLGYSGYVGAEYRPAQGTLEGLTWFEPYS